MSDTDPKRTSLGGFVGELFKIVARGATSEQWAEWLRLPLEHAAADGNIDLFNELIGAGADGRAGWRGCGGRTLFDAAALGGNAEVVSGLTAAGAQPDVNVVSASSGLSALYLATSLGHENAARRLVMAGADVNFRDPDGSCDVLDEAVARGCEELVDDLLVAGANPSGASPTNTSSPGSGRHTPLHVAAESGSTVMVSALLARGADKNALDISGGSPLIRAAEEGNLKVVNILLAAGADVEIRNDVDCSAFDRAARRGQIGVLKALVGHGADVNAAGVNTGCTALHRAATFGQVSAMDALIEAGADMEVKSSDGRTPLCMAALHIRREAVRTLLQHGANADVRDFRGNTLLHLACRTRIQGMDTVVDLLLQTGVDETAVDNDGVTPAAQLLKPGTDSFGRGRSSPRELERTRLLLDRAPNDRAWRRRRWLVMLCSRASRARTAAGCDDNGDGSGHGATAADGRGESGDSNATSGEHSRGSESSVIEQANVIGVGGEDGSLRAVVTALIELQLEGVFRTVVSFL